MRLLPAMSNFLIIAFFLIALFAETNAELQKKASFKKLPATTAGLPPKVPSPVHTASASSPDKKLQTQKTLNRSPNVKVPTTAGLPPKVPSPVGSPATSPTNAELQKKASFKKLPSAKVPTTAGLPPKVPSPAQRQAASPANPKFASVVQKTQAQNGRRASSEQIALSRWKSLHIAIHTINSLEDLVSDDTLAKAKARDEIRQARWRSAWQKVQKGWHKLTEGMRDWMLDLDVFGEWLMRAEHVELLVQVLISMGSMKTPICVTLEMLEGIKGTEPIVNAIHKLDKQQQWQNGTTTENGVGGVKAYMFGHKGLVPLLLTESAANLSCADSLDEPKETATLLKQTIEALQANSTDQALNLVMASVIKHLQNAAFDKQLGTVGRKVVEGWTEATRNMSWAKVGHGLEKFAVWVIAPKHVEFVIKTVLYVTGLDVPIKISLDILAAFGLDQVLVHYYEGMGVKLINHGVNDKLVMWVFGPNGVIPLFLRNGKETDEKMPEYVDHTGTSYTRTELDKIYHTLQDERTFLRHIMEQIIRHQGHPFHELMDHMVADFTHMGDKVQHGMQRMAQKMDAEWHKIKAVQWHDVEKGFVSAWMFLITPAHVNNVIKIVLTLTHVDEPVYLTLEVLEALHITDFMEKGLIKAEQAMHDWEFIKNHRKMVGAVDFMISKDGLVPLLLKDGDTKFDRPKRIAEEATIMKAVVDIAMDNQGAVAIFTGLWNAVVTKFTNKSTLLAILQKWNSLNIELRTSSKTMYEELSEMKKQKIAERKIAAVTSQQEENAKNNNGNNIDVAKKQQLQAAKSQQ